VWLDGVHGDELAAKEFGEMAEIVGDVFEDDEKRTTFFQKTASEIRAELDSMRAARGSENPPCVHTHTHARNSNSKNTEGRAGRMFACYAALFTAKNQPKNGPLYLERAKVTTSKGNHYVFWRGEWSERWAQAWMSFGGVAWLETFDERHTAHDDLSDVIAAVTTETTSLTQLAAKLGVDRSTLTRRIERQTPPEQRNGDGEIIVAKKAADWLQIKLRALQTQVPNFRPIALPTCDCAACKPFKGYRVVKADAYTVTCATPKGGTYQLPRAAVASIHVIDAQLPKPEDLDAVCALIDSLPDHASQVCLGDTLWTRRGTRWTIAPHSTG
jgi:lambda repressor-like predicted transcriptional regulator